MKVQLSNFFRSRRCLAAMGILVVALAMNFYYQNLGQQLAKIPHLNAGIMTCFTRIGQSHTAHLLRQVGRSYLQVDFFSMTEECLGEVINYADSVIGASYPSIHTKLNQLATDTHEFHKSLEKKPASTQGPEELKSPSRTGEVSINNKFAKLEDLREQILGLTNMLAEKIESTLQWIVWPLYLLFFMVPVLFGMEYYSTYRRNQRNRELEIDAAGQLLDDEMIAGRFNRTISQALENNDLINCSELFEKYQITYFKNAQASKVIEQEVDNANKIAEKITSPQAEEVSAQVASSEVADVDVGTISLDQSFSTILEMISDRLFMSSIHLDMQIEEDIFAVGNKEIIEQILYQLFILMINSCNQTVGMSKKISVSLKKLGGSAIFELDDNGVGMDPLLIRWHLGMDSKLKCHLPTELEIGLELARELKAGVNFENILNHDGIIVGSRYRVMLRLIQKELESGKDPRRTLIQLRKGTKKDILREMN